LKVTAAILHWKFIMRFRDLKHLVAAAWVSLALTGCVSVPTANVETFSTGVSAAKSQTSIAFKATTDLTSDAIIDYAAAQPTLNEKAFFSVLDSKSIAVWDKTFSALEKYCQNLILLDSTDSIKGYQDAAVNLATEVQQVGENLKSQQLIAANPSISPSLAAAFTDLGGLLLHSKAQHDLKKILAQTDPTIRKIMGTMADAIGVSSTNNLRGTVNAHWEQLRGQQSVAFLEAKTQADKRSIAAKYAGLLTQERTQDLALSSLRQSFLALADAHHALAMGHQAEVGASVLAVQRELQNTLDLTKQFSQISKPTAN
jgi:hypothetical protein